MIKKNYKILLYIITIFSALFSSTQIFAIDTVDAGFDDRFEFSEDSIKKNVKIKAYTYFDNNSEFDLKTTLAFYVDNKKIETKTLFIPRKTRTPIWTTIRISEESLLIAKLLSLQKDVDGVLEGVYSNNKETKIKISPNQSVPKLSKVQSAIVGNSKDIIDVAEQKRLDINSSLKDSIDDIEVEAEKSDGLTFKKIWLWILKIFHTISDNFILSLIAFAIFSFYLLSYTKRGYQKMKK